MLRSRLAALLGGGSWLGWFLGRSPLTSPRGSSSWAPFSWHRRSGPSLASRTRFGAVVVLGVSVVLCAGWYLWRRPRPRLPPSPRRDWRSIHESVTSPLPSYHSYAGRYHSSYPHWTPPVATPRWPPPVVTPRPPPPVSTPRSPPSVAPHSNRAAKKPVKKHARREPFKHAAAGKRQFKKKKSKFSADANERFAANNANLAGDMIDLHDLCRRNALLKLHEWLARCRAGGLVRLTVIVGQGKHSPNGESVLRPAVTQWFRTMQPDCIVELDESNAGRLIVTID